MITHGSHHMPESTQPRADSVHRGWQNPAATCATRTTPWCCCNGEASLAGHKPTAAVAPGRACEYLSSVLKELLVLILLPQLTHGAALQCGFLRVTSMGRPAQENPSCSSDGTPCPTSQGAHQPWWHPRRWLWRCSAGSAVMLPLGRWILHHSPLGAPHGSALPWNGPGTFPTWRGGSWGIVGGRAWKGEKEKLKPCEGRKPFTAGKHKVQTHMGNFILPCIHAIHHIYTLQHNHRKNKCQV